MDKCVSNNLCSKKHEDSAQLKQNLTTRAYLQILLSYVPYVSTICNIITVCYSECELTLSSKVPWESSVCRFCSNNANPDAYDISSSCNTETATQKSAQCIGDS